MLKSIIIRLLEIQTKRYLKKHKPKLVAVAGSIGKTSTKVFAATLLSEKYNVLAQEGNYNTHVSVPMAVFDLPIPENLGSPSAWLKVLWWMQLKISRPKIDHDVIVLELGTDAPGDIAKFGRYLKPDIGLVTAVVPEHMEFFKTIDAVAKEELTIAQFCALTLVNRDEVDAKFASLVKSGTMIDTYGTSGVAEYHFLIEDFVVGQGYRGKFVSPELGEISVTLKLAGEHSIKAAVAAGAIGVKLGLTAKQIATGMGKIQPVKGRMRILKGLNDSTLIDDTYNSSPTAAIAALQTLYVFPAKQKIAILGSMNELGEYSKQAHEEVGQKCDPTLLDWVVTVGDEAERYLAPAAVGRGCQVRSFKNPYDAGAFVHSVIHPNAVVLAKGSQNGVFAEEALKVLLHATEEEQELVRQSPEWLAIKQKMFEKIIQTDPRDQ